MARRYPLEPLLGVRRERVERQAAVHRGARQHGDQQAALAAAARARRESAERHFEGERAEERQLLEEGTVRAHDLQQAERYRVGATARIAVERESEAAAERRAEESAKVVERARATLAQQRADEEAVLAHARRSHEAEARAAELAEEAEAADYFAATRPGARRG